MGVHTEWARATDRVELITEDDDFVDAHGTGLDPGKVGLAFAEVLVEGTRDELADFARRILAALTPPGKVVDDLWAEDPRFPRRDWHYEVSNDDTLLGYWDWVAIRENDQLEEEL